VPRRRRTFVFPLNSSGTVVLRSRLETDKGRVTGFAIQLEALDDTERAIILRFDTAHGYVHVHSFDGESAGTRTPMQFFNWEVAYTYCYEYARQNWETELTRYMRKKR
jgi:hypothetical protein